MINVIGWILPVDWYDSGKLKSRFEIVGLDFFSILNLSNFEVISCFKSLINLPAFDFSSGFTVPNNLYNSFTNPFLPKYLLIRDTESPLSFWND